MQWDTVLSSMARSDGADRKSARHNFGIDVDAQFDHFALLNSPEIGLAADFLEDDGAIDNPCDDEYIQVCGHCGHKLAAYHSEYGPAEYGDRADVGRLSETLCPSCFNANFRHASPIATRSFVKRMDRDSRWYREIIFARADSAFWAGELTDEVGVLISKDIGLLGGRKHQLSSVGIDWMPQCPACAEPYDGSEFDFHHWDYEKDRGCMLCRECHQHTHQNLTATEQSKETGKNWRNDAIERLYQLSIENGIECEDFGTFLQRFNIPISDESIAVVEKLEVDGAE